MLGMIDSTSQVGICGARMVFPDGTLQHAGVVFGSGKQGPYHLLRTRPSHLMPRVDREFQAVTGACMLVKDELWRKLGGLDEDYPFGLEDIDFCLRARAGGMANFLLPRQRVAALRIHDPPDGLSWTSTAAHFSCPAGRDATP